MKRRKTKTTIEIHQVYVIRQPEASPHPLCPECATQPPSMVTPEEAAGLTTLRLRTIYAAVEAGLLHYQECTDGRLLVCLNSFPVPTLVMGSTGSFSQAPNPPVNADCDGNSLSASGVPDPDR